MSRLAQSNFIQGGYYHVYNRGNRADNIFFDTKDYKRYLDRLKQYKKKHDVSVIAYCLMPNHLHLLLRQNGPKPISTFIQRVHTAYTMYLNNKHKTTGHVFESRYKAKIVNRDDLLSHLSRYIHLEPKTVVKRLPAYKWSSYPTYIGQTPDEITEPNIVLSMFKRKNQTQEDAILAYKLFVQKAQKPPPAIDHLLFAEV